MMVSFHDKLAPTTSKRSRWQHLALRWFSLWDKLPFLPPNWWPSIFAANACRSPSSSSAIHPESDQSSYKNCEEDHPIKDGKGIAISSTNKALIRSLTSDFLNGIVEGDAELPAEGVAIRTNEAVMDVRIWSSLPEDIIEKVLARLPLSSVLRFRAVCHRWNIALSSRSFLRSYSKSSLHRQPCFLLCTIGQFACTYDPSLGKWLTLLKPTPPGGASVIASTGSLLCLGNQVTECRVLSVCNPITRSFRRLPAMSKLRLIHKITMVEDQSSNCYTIVVAGEDGLPMPNPHNFKLITEVFNSRQNTWHAAEDPPLEAKFGSDPGVWFEGAFYCITELPYGIVKFCPEEGIWEEVSVVMPPALWMPSLAVVRNRLLMVGRCKVDSQTRAADVVCIWELMRRSKEKSKREDDGAYGEQDGYGVVVNRKEETGVVYCNEVEYEWVEAMEMPRSVSKEFLAPLASYSPFVCAGVGSSIFMTTHLSPKVLVLDLSLSGSAGSSTTSWKWLPQDPLFPTHRDFHLMGFSFEPRFNTFP